MMSSQKTASSQHTDQQAHPFANLPALSSRSLLPTGQSSPSMKIPRKWQILSFENNDKRLQIGLDFLEPSSDPLIPTTFGYTVYLTDYSYVWYCHAEDKKLRSQFASKSYDMSMWGSAYDIILTAFRSNFQGTILKLQQRMYDQGVPLEMEMEMTVPEAELTWEFEFNRLPEVSALSIIRNLALYESTVTFALHEFTKALIKELESKDKVINILKEHLGNQVPTLLENGSTKHASRPFDSQKFVKSWEEHVHTKFHGMDIWDDFLKSNNEAQTYTLGSLFKDSNLLALKKRASQEAETFRLMQSPNEHNRTSSVDSVNELHTKNSPGPGIHSPDGQPIDSPSRRSSSTPIVSPTPPASNSASPKKGKKKGSVSNPFGVSQKKRVAHQPTYSPIKAPRNY